MNLTHLLALARGFRRGFNDWLHMPADSWRRPENLVRYAAGEADCAIQILAIEAGQ